MKIYLVQHGEAKSEAEVSERPLTDKGKEEVKRLSMVAKRLNIHPLKVYHSGKLRAKQTAEIIASGVEISDSMIQMSQGLNPNDDVHSWSVRISKESDDLMLVGHLPFLEKLTSLLLCGDENRKVILFRYGAIVCLDQKENRKWAIRWMLTPEMV